MSMKQEYKQVEALDPHTKDLNILLRRESINMFT